MKNYGFDESQVQESKPKFPVSEQLSNVELRLAEYVSGKDKHGKSFEGIDFYFVRELEGGGYAELKDRQFSVDESNIDPKPGKQLDEVINEAYTSFNTRLVHIAKAFGLTRQDVFDATKESSTFQELIKNYSDLLNNNAKGKKVWLKTLPSKNGWPRVPAFPDFIEAMTSDPCTLAYSKWEKGQFNKNTAPQNGVHEEDDTDFVSSSEDDF